MKLGTLDDGSPDGVMVVVDRSLGHCCRAPHLARTLQQAIDLWDSVAVELTAIYRGLNASDRSYNAESLDVSRLHAPLPRGFQWLDASAYLRHVELVRKARGAEMPSSALSDPVMYQGASAPFRAWNSDILIRDAGWGPDFEAELVVLTGDVGMGASKADCSAAIRLIGLVNDVSLRGLIPTELAKGFGFIHGKPPTAFAPVLVTPDELGQQWDGERADLSLKVDLNGATVGQLRTGSDMHFSFADLLWHAAKTRPLCAGTVLGAGTVSNRAEGSGYGCLAERRALDMIDGIEPLTPLLAEGDTVDIEAFDAAGSSVFGRIAQRVRVQP